MPKTHPISISAQEHGLAGNLVLPDGASAEAPVPGAILLGGPGPVPLQRYTSEGTKQWPVTWSEALGEGGMAAVCYDQRGSGLSSGHYHVADWDALYEDNCAVLDLLKLQPEVAKVAAIAWGEGCAFALQLAAEERVDALVLMAPAYRTAEERYAAGIAQLAKSKGLSDRVVQLRVNQWRAEVQAQIKLVEQGDRYALTDLGDQKLPTNRVRFLQTVAFDPASLMPHIKVPVLLQHGEDDAVIPPAESAAMANALTGERDRITYPGVAHFLYRHHRATVDALGWLNHVLV